MDSKYIEQLLEKYWSCDTSLEEEKQLREYFNNTDLGPQWKETAALFRYFEHQKKDSLVDQGFDASVIKKIKASQPKSKTVQMITYGSRIAAGVAVMAVAYYLVRSEIRKSYPEDTYSDPKLALEETKKAFMMISKSFGKAQVEAQKINLINEAEQKIEVKKPDEEKKTSI